MDMSGSAGVAGTRILHDRVPVPPARAANGGLNQGCREGISTCVWKVAVSTTATDTYHNRPRRLAAAPVTN